jgi:hypothetical protein
METQSSPTQFWLVNAVEHQKQYPASFELPDEWNRSHVVVGELAKLIFAFPAKPEHTFERMWVEVVEALPDRYHGILTNEPPCDGFITIGHRLAFNASHIISIWPPRVYQEPLLPPQ